MTVVDSCYYSQLAVMFRMFGRFEDANDCEELAYQLSRVERGEGPALDVVIAAQVREGR
jgi:hypothetical protein